MSDNEPVEDQRPVNDKCKCLSADMQGVSVSAMSTTKILTFAATLHLFLVAVEYDLELDEHSSTKMKNLGVVSMTFSAVSCFVLLTLWGVLLYFGWHYNLLEFSRDPKRSRKLAGTTLCVYVVISGCSVISVACDAIRYDNTTKLSPRGVIVLILLCSDITSLLCAGLQFTWNLVSSPC